MPTQEKGQVQFIQFHQPALESGTYHLKVEQTIKDTQNRIEGSEGKTYSRELTFAVQGERFGPLPPNDIYAVFPPLESLGEHSNVLPHITFKRSTLPWERYPGTTEKSLPWLILLLFRESDFDDNEDDTPKTKNITLSELIATTNNNSNIKYPTDMELELGQTLDQQVTVIDVKKKYLVDILPTYSDLSYTSHVRKGKTEENPQTTEEEYSTIISNRLPEANGKSTVYLVSIEGRYPDSNGNNFDYQNAGDDDYIRFVSLASWELSCIDPAQSFTQLLQRLNHNPSTPRLPQSENLQAEAYLKKGYVTVPHSLRKGSKTYSWYRSPLTTNFNVQEQATYQFPVKASDQLLRYDSNIGMFDISYSAAWQLGRMLMLENQGLAVQLFNWKREVVQVIKRLQQQEIQLPLINPPTSETKFIPDALKLWFQGLGLLQGIPFNYLVPDERLLPPESIRFFCLDSVWVDCLQDGAFSIGRVTSGDLLDDGQITKLNDFLQAQNKTITGIIMRSQVVSGWPGLLVDGYDTAVGDLDSIDPTEGQLLPLLRMENLAKDVLICLFEGEVKTVDIHLKPESMHFGLDAPTKDSPEWSKNLRDENGELMDKFLISPIPWNSEEKEVINLQDFATQMNRYLNLEEFTSGQFGLQMIEGVQKVRFVFQQ
ncbi:hypothetical protein [Crocosphaera sp. Alani8]|uniref:hypothetical protein n=1 Tax=Crocosphaera sp. Alani8 TaxID=3038952 RepID=UPI00313B1E9B